MNRHPYKPANRRGLVLRIRTNADSVMLDHRNLGPCVFSEGGEVCGRLERVQIHQQPFGHRYETKTKAAPELKGAGKDAPVY